MAKKNATTKSRTSTRRTKTAQTLARAVTRVTNPALLREIAKTSIKSEDDVDLTDLAVTILSGRETHELVQWLMRANQEDEISTVLGTVIAASRIADRA